ncbi:MAG: S8 family serine peptidase [Chitinophagaceae bacterium]|nr:S8 family serine peptidase [Chitinophagaceae bacterium]
MAAAERADSLGVDVFTTSLGYTTFDNSSFNHTYADMNGNSTIMARAANLAVKKGILALAAAGNDGNNSWHYISTQGDADSVLTIGAVNVNRQVASFSSYGPNSDGQIKPDIAAMGSSVVVAGTSTGQPVFGNGTSYAAPIMAGITTCLWQAFPEIKNTAIVQGLRESGDRYSNPDDRSGYGIPDKKSLCQFYQTTAYTICSNH